MVCRPPVFLWYTLWDTSWRSPSTRAMASQSRERSTEPSTSCRRQRCQLHWTSPLHCPLARAWAGLGISGQRWTCLEAPGALCSVCVCVYYHNPTFFMCELYSCKLCESRGGHINFYRINFIAPSIIIWNVPIHTNKNRGNFSRGPFLLIRIIFHVHKNVTLRYVCVYHCVCMCHIWLIHSNSLVLWCDVDSEVRLKAARDHTKEGRVNVTLPRTTSPLCWYINTQ